jgi:hypothetical protein
MAASVSTSSWIDAGLNYIDITWQANSGGACNSLGILNGISGKVEAARIVTHNPASGYAPHSGYGVTLNTGGGFDVLRGYGAALVSADALSTLYYSQASLDFFLFQDSLRLAVTSGGDNRTGKVQLVLDWKKTY